MNELNKLNKKKEIHQILSTFFESQPHFQRTIEELAYQYENSGFLFNFYFLIHLKKIGELFKTCY